MKNRSFDLIVYGATSFVGQILTRYLFEHIGVGGKVNWAIAGRSEKVLPLPDTREFAAEHCALRHGYCR